MKIVGITGKIGAGKSLLLSYLKENDNYYVVESDIVAKSLYYKGGSVYKSLINCFGEELLDDTGEIDKKKLSLFIFSDDDKLAKLNSIVHPAVKEEILRLIEEKKNEGIEIFFIEAALLIQDGYKEICDEIWFIKVDTETRIARLMNNRGYSRKKCIDIISTQPDDLYYMKNSDYTLDNDHTPELLISQAKDILNK